MIGAGEGAPDLLSLAAARALGRADFIMHERRVPKAVLALGRRDAEKVSFDRSARAPYRRWTRLIGEVRLGRNTCIVRMGDLDRFQKSAEARLLLAAGIPMTLLRPAPR